MDFRRHGDVPLHPAEMLEGTAVKHNGSFTLAEGETTGHNHVLSVDNPEHMRLVKTDQGIFIQLIEAGILTHPEHGTLTVGPGTYRQGAERELDWFSQTTRKVVD